MKEMWKFWNKKLHSNFSIKFILLICLSLILIIEIQQLITQPKIIAKSINLRTIPSSNSKIIRRIPHNSRFKILKKDNQNNWWYINSDNQKGWVASWLIKNKTYQPEHNNNLPESTIVLDPGHGGNDSGTLSSNNKMEKNYTLPTALKTYNTLKKTKAQIILTRNKDESVSLAKRTDISNDMHANLFISFHFNSSNNDGISKGFEIFKYHHNADKFANILSKQFNNLPLENRNIDFGNFYVLRENNQPAILTEMGFMDDKNDFEHINNPKYQQEVANDIGQAVQKYLK